MRKNKQKEREAKLKECSCEELEKETKMRNCQKIEAEIVQQKGQT